ncbi:hypothetical protein [Agromyces silvae]|uniref:hypothetical protein n=1 Tax=Agromyces silvae TaxID=3388266 RepID=UPI00280A512E|nr:hypothetical protein [Agromyces protaetiae]
MTLSPTASLGFRRVRRVPRWSAVTAFGAVFLAAALITPAGAASGAEAGSAACDFDAGLCVVDPSNIAANPSVIVPADTHVMTAVVVGGNGGANSTGVLGGQGGLTVATFPVTPGEQLRIMLGEGADGPTPGAGYSSGGRGGPISDTPTGMPTGGGGGGSTAVLDASDQPIVVSGGGGGAGGDMEGSGDAGGQGGSGGSPAKDGWNGAPNEQNTDGAAGGEGGAHSTPDGEDTHGMPASPTTGAGGGGWNGNGGGGGGHGDTGAPIDDGIQYGAAGGGGGGQSYVSPAVTTWTFLSAGPMNTGGDGVVALFPRSTAAIYQCADGTQDYDLAEGATRVFGIVGGGAGESTRDNAQGGGGAVVTGTFDVAGPQQLQVVVGCSGERGGYGWSSGGAGGHGGTAEVSGGTGGGSTQIDITGLGGPKLGAGGGGGAGGGIFEPVCNCPGGDGGSGIPVPVAGGVGQAGDGGVGGGALGGNPGPGGNANGASGDDGQNHTDGAPGGGGGGGIFNGGSFGRAGGFSSSGGGGGAGSSFVSPDAALVSGGTLDPRDGYVLDGIAVIVPIFAAEDAPAPSPSPGPNDPSVPPAGGGSAADPSGSGLRALPATGAAWTAESLIVLIAAAIAAVGWGSALVMRRARGRRAQI